MSLAGKVRLQVVVVFLITIVSVIVTGCGMFVHQHPLSTTCTSSSEVS